MKISQHKPDEFDIHCSNVLNSMDNIEDVEEKLDVLDQCIDYLRLELAQKEECVDYSDFINFHK